MDPFLLWPDFSWVRGSPHFWGHENINFLQFFLQHRFFPHHIGDLWLFLWTHSFGTFFFFPQADHFLLQIQYNRVFFQISPLRNGTLSMVILGTLCLKEFIIKNKWTNKQKQNKTYSASMTCLLTKKENLCTLSKGYLDLLIFYCDGSIWNGWWPAVSYGVCEARKIRNKLNWSLEWFTFNVRKKFLWIKDGKNWIGFLKKIDNIFWMSPKNGISSPLDIYNYVLLLWYNASRFFHNWDSFTQFWRKWNI